ncbi:UNVERIFIED_CONTAM: hydantoinase/oxoprolinase family protein, partial [Bacteroidetes bacterium 56_B9]
TRAEALAEATAEARAAAVEAGADAETIELVELIELPLGHIEGQVLRVCARAAGALRELEDA